MGRSMGGWLAIQILLAGSICVGPSMLSVPVAQAYTARSEVFVESQGNESYQALMRRSEAAARAAVQRTFDRDILVSIAYVIVIVQNGGYAAPVLAIEVGRQDWRSRPDPRYWASYMRSSQALLGLGQDPTNAVTVTPTSTSTPSTTTPGTPTSGTPAPGAAAPGTTAPTPPTSATPTAPLIPNRLPVPVQSSPTPATLPPLPSP